MKAVYLDTAHLQGDGHILSSDDGMLLIGPMDHKHSSQCILTAVPSSPSVSITKAWSHTHAGKLRSCFL